MYIHDSYCCRPFLSHNLPELSEEPSSCSAVPAVIPIVELHLQITVESDV